MIAIARLVRAPIDERSELAALADPATGALASFVGRVRNEHEGRAVAHLEYHAHDGLAVAQMERILAEAGARWDVRGALLVHRLGRLELGEASVLAAAACPHRGESFEACRYLIERLKVDVPIWKHEHYADVGALPRWIGAE